MAALGHSRPYLYGQSFLLQMDHASLTWLLNFKEPEGQLVRWLKRLQDCDFSIQHRAGWLRGSAGTRTLCPGGTTASGLRSAFLPACHLRAEHAGTHLMSHAARRRCPERSRRATRCCHRCWGGSGPARGQTMLRFLLAAQNLNRCIHGGVV